MQDVNDIKENAIRHRAAGHPKWMRKGKRRESKYFMWRWKYETAYKVHIFEVAIFWC